MSSPSAYNDPYDSTFTFTYSIERIVEDDIGKHFFKMLIGQNNTNGIALSDVEIEALRTRPYQEMIKYLLQKNSSYIKSLSVK